MAPETGVLNGDKGIDQVLGQFIISGRFAVGTAGHQGIGQIARRVIDSGSKAVGLNV